MTINNFISIDEVKFLKTSKKLLHYLSTEHSLNIKPSQIQEALAQSLGYRNVNDLQKIFVGKLDAKPIVLIESIPKPDIFDNLELDQAIQIITILMNEKGGNMWQNKAISFISVVLKALMHMQKEKELILDSEAISEYLILDNINKLYKIRRDFPEDIRQELRSYLLSLPGYQESVFNQSNTVIDYHGNLQMQFFSVLNMLKKIEENNFLIADKRWFILNEEKSNNSNQTEKYFTLAISPTLENFDFLKDSWLAIPEYENWIISLINNNTLEEIRVSDLLVYVTTIISPSNRHSLSLLLINILENYSIYSKISKQICGSFR